MISLAALDKVLNVDSDKGQVRVQAGARVQEVVDAIKPYGLTLQNYASVREQQIGGFIQVKKGEDNLCDLLKILFVSG